jgi:hypothetical protein
MSFRRLAVACGLTLADYLLWNWSTSRNHDVLALVSGVTLPFLVLACAVLLVLSLARVISSAIGSSQRPVARLHPGSTESHEYRARRSPTAAGPARGTGRTATSPESPEPTSASAPSGSPSPASSARQRAA